MGKVVVNENRCKGCELCIDTCPHGLLSLGQRLNKSGYHVICVNDEQNKCTGCALCARICPDVALEVYT